MIAGLACGLAAMTKEMRNFTVLVAFAVLLLYSASKWGKALFLLSATLFFTSITIIELVGAVAVPSLMTSVTPHLHHLFLIAILFVLLWWLSKHRVQAGRERPDA